MVLWYLGRQKGIRVRVACFSVVFYGFNHLYWLPLKNTNKPSHSHFLSWILWQMTALLAPLGSCAAKRLLSRGVSDVLTDSLSWLSFPCRACFSLGSLCFTAEQIPTRMRLAAPTPSVLGGPSWQKLWVCSQAAGLSLVPNMSKIKLYLHSWVPLCLV